jgi:hypothetical protein
MTVKTSYAPAVLVADGTADEIPLPWQFFDPADVIVTRVKDDVRTPLLLSRDYAVIGGKDANGVPQIGLVKLAWVPEAGTEIRAERTTPKIQLENYDRRFEVAADRIMLIAQEAVQTVVEKVVVHEVRTVREVSEPAPGDVLHVDPGLAPAEAPDVAPLKSKLLEHEKAFQGLLQIIDDQSSRLARLEGLIVELADAAQQKLNAA